MGAIVIDSSVLIGLTDKSDVHHLAAREAIETMNLECVCIPASVLAEFLVSTARHEPARLEQVKADVTTSLGPARVIDDDIAVAVAQLRAKHRSLRLPDALVIATGIVDDAEVILTADARWKGIDPRIRLLQAA